MKFSGVLFTIACLSLAPMVRGEFLGDPFEDARFAPADVTTYVHVEDAAGLRAEIADRPIARWLSAIVENGQIHQSWSGLAKSSQFSEKELFDQYLGTRTTLLVRRDGQWALLTNVQESKVTALLRNLKVRVREPRNGMIVSELPEQEMLLARDGGRLVIGPARQSDLFFDLIARLDRENPRHVGETLADSAAIAQARSLGDGRIGVLLRMQPPLGGHLEVVANLQGDQLVIQQAAKFDHAPFNHGVTKLTCDFSPVVRFEDRSLLAFMQPTDLGDGPVESFVTASLGEGLVSKEMRQNFGDRRMFVVSEVEGRALEKPVDILSTSFVCCTQLKDADHAIEQVDDQMVKVTKKLNELSHGAYLVPMPKLNGLSPSQPREVDLSPATDWFTGGFPIMKNVKLSWTVTKGQSGAWLVVASHREPLDEVVAELKNDCPTNPKFEGKFDSCGVGNGIRIGRHLRSWCDEADKFAAPGQVDEFRATLQMMSQLAEGVQSCQWQLERPTANEMRLNVQVKLAPPESARP